MCATTLSRIASGRVRAPARPEPNARHDLLVFGLNRCWAFFEPRCAEREPYRLRCAIRWWHTLGSGRAGARTLPPKGRFENFTLIWPRFNRFDKAGSDGIISNVLPPGLGALMRPNTMMEAVFLPAARRVPKCGGESAFPVFDPRIEKGRFQDPATRIGGR
jgi:hypothetical protein